MNSTPAPRRSEQGFTLVELAIVMIIIGLLIGGILKGQELITNARVASTVAQIKGIDAATTTFRDKYNAFPGDMNTAANRLPPACGAGVACTNGSGDGRIANAPGAAPSVESQQFFQHLNAADLISGINPALAGVPGGIYAEANIRGGFNVGYSAGRVALASSAAPAANIKSGHFLALMRDPSQAMPATGIITPNQMGRIDARLDDGVPTTGNVLAAGAGTCTLAGPPVTYNDARDSDDCNGYIRFQQ